MNLSKSGKFISIARKQLNKTQKELAAEIGVTDKAVSRWETGKGFPDVSILPALAVTLGVSLSEIIMGEKIELEEKRAIEIIDQAVVTSLDFSLWEIRNSTQFTKYIVACALFILALISLFTLFFIRDHNGKEFVFDGDYFKLSRVSSRQITLIGTSGDELVYVRNTRASKVQQECSYKGNNMSFGGGYDSIIDSELSLGYTFSDGTRAAILTELTAIQQREVQMLEALREYFDNDVSLKHRYPFYYALGLIFFVVCVPLVLYPIFYTKETLDRNWLIRLFNRGGETTEFALFASKVLGWFVFGVMIIIFLRVIVL